MRGSAESRLSVPRLLVVLVDQREMAWEDA